jgi:hypothetical protein
MTMTTMMTPQGRDMLAKVKNLIKPGPVNAETTDEEIAQRARVFGHDLAVPYQVLEHIMKVERRLVVVESALAVANEVNAVISAAQESVTKSPTQVSRAQV